ncbi:HEAT repeat domain-containing protein [Maribacter sp. 2307ULW6-5]|uniref:DUF7133 domain-containing protein n=1 Tax=Maribacter sp. 2307ULW6-5 TaxID=3386275 RepID=UPI0039BD0888
MTTPIRWAMALVALPLFFACTQKKPMQTPLVVHADSTQLEADVDRIKKSVTTKVAPGLELSLWATDSLAPDPIAMDIDDHGNIYLTRTNRQKNSEFDIRGHRDWMTPSIALQTVEDRREFLRATFAPERSAENNWLPDLNKDSVHDWRDLAVQKDEVWKLVDANKDGKADRATLILEDFNTEVSDVAGALLVRDEDVFVGIAPDMWRLRDTNGDEVLDEKTSIATGFQVHIGFSGHGMSGAIQGPDGKIYWAIGDIGAHITTVEGEEHPYPNQGVIVRSNPDGSDFEVFAHGLRNTHEFVFDAHGNIISSDNDGDHQGESERLVHIVEGSDAGWRANWQYGKYTDPDNNGYNVWMDEALYKPRWEGQAAYIIPPIVNFHNGPTGMVYNPGTALGSKWTDRFFLVEFVGEPSRSHIWSFNLKPKGASFDLDTDWDILSGVLPTGIDFGPDGALYLADWINGWGTKDYGRVWKLDVTEEENDLAEQRKKTEALMTHDYEGDSTANLVALLAYPDMRIRQKAQFALAERTFWGFRALREVLEKDNDQLAKIHAIWGLGQMAAKDLDKAEALLPLLESEDGELVAQAAKVLGDVRYAPAAPQLLSLLEHDHARAVFFAAQALGRLEHREAIPALMGMIARNADEDVYLRHAGVLALSRMGEAQPLLDLAGDENRSLRLAAVLVLRKLRHPGIARFLKDADPYIVTEAARAINDDFSIPEALPDLAAVLTQEGHTAEPLLRRAINAALRVGTETEMEALIAFTKRSDVPNTLRGEALAALGTWGNPSPLDRVDGRYRGEITRDVVPLKQKLENEIPRFLETGQPELMIGAAKMLGALEMPQYNELLFTYFRESEDPSVRAALLQSLGQLDFSKMEAAMAMGMQDGDQGVRRAAVGLLSSLDLPAEQWPAVVRPIFRTGGTGEQQAVLRVLSDLPQEKSLATLEQLLQMAGKGQIDREVMLDLMEAVERTDHPELNDQLALLEKRGYGTDDYQEAMYGGNWWRGKMVFENNSTAQCVRCHALNGSGGEVGPPMDNIANILTREQLLESLIAPSKRLAPGYGSVMLTLQDGQEVNGVLLEESDTELLLRTGEAEPMRVPLKRIKERENSVSAMPAMGKMITKRELRDLMEFLGSLKDKGA